MKSAAEIVARARAEIDAGRPWKAKEILRGRIGSAPFEPEIFDAYGLLLERMGDRFEAGKYLFLSGKRSPDRTPAIEHFLKRQAGRRGADIWARFPATVRAAPFESLPAIVQQELTALGFERGRSGQEVRQRPPMSRRDRLGLLWAVIVLGVFVIALLIGIGTMAAWLWEWLT